MRRKTLRVVASPDPRAVDRVFELDGAIYVIGRDSKDIERIEDPHLSRKQAKIYPGDTGYLIENLGGTNGTFLDGARITKAEALGPGSVISCGDTLIVADDEPDPDLMPVLESIDGETLTGVGGISLVARRLRKSLATIAAARGSVLLLGPTGAGKEVAAQAIHQASGRGGRFIAVNCATIPAELAESSLFGHVKGAFTGAVNDQDGYFTQAHGGTLFLDEVGDLPIAMQPKLLRVLEDSTVTPVGAKAGKKVDVRVVAATHLELDDTTFRRDLFARIGNWVLRLPPLRERRADVLALFERFLGRAVALPSEFQEALLLHDWPMNVRELVNLSMRIQALIGSKGAPGLELLPGAMQAPLLDRFEAEGDEEEAEDPRSKSPDRQILEMAIKRSLGNVQLAAQQNGWHRTQLYRWLRRAKIDPSAFRPPE